MRAVVQRVNRASVRVDGNLVSAIDSGFMVLLGVGKGDGAADVEYICRKIAELRVFEDEQGKMNLSIDQTGGSILLVSQFTLYGDARKGKRPSFSNAEEPVQGNLLFERVAEKLRERAITVETGSFGAHMSVELVNDGPVTVLLDSGKLF